MFYEWSEVGVRLLAFLGAMLIAMVLGNLVSEHFVLFFMEILETPFSMIQWGKKVFDPLLILYVCPLTNKWSVYNFNGRFIWTVRDRITNKKIQKNTCQKCYTFICILTREISIWPLCKTWLSRAQLWCTCTDLAFWMEAVWTGSGSGGWCT